MPDGARLRGGALVLTLPNAITFARLCTVPLAVWLVLRGDMANAFWLFVMAGLSDALDGWLARRGHGSAVGAVLDPITDKAMLVSMYVTLAAAHVLPFWIAILVVFRDLLIVGGVLALAVLGQAVTIHPLFISKLNTALQIILIACAMLENGYGLRVPHLVDSLVVVVAASTVASGAAYVGKAAVWR
ncbi:MAG: CDP-alcohol phosphatidyltransferase family protein [Acetobacteraceae bacterium]